MLVVIRNSEVHLAGESCEEFPDSGKVVLHRLEPDEMMQLSEEICEQCFPNLS